MEDKVEFVKIYYPDGKIKSEIPIKNGMVDGVWKEYHKNGNLKFEKPYENGIKDGDEVNYLEDGSLSHISHYPNGVYAGKTYLENQNQKKRYRTSEPSSTTLLEKEFIYDEKGFLKREKHYKDNKLHGNVLSLNGQIKNLTKVEPYVNGKKHGYHLVVDNGKIEKLQKYHHGVLIKKISLKKDDFFNLDTPFFRNVDIQSWEFGVVELQFNMMFLDEDDEYANEKEFWINITLYTKLENKKLNQIYNVI